LIEAVDLAAQLADRPVPADALDLIETALGVVGDLDKLCEVREGQAEDQFGMGRDQLWSH
jgi:hypothetical protein